LFVVFKCVVRVGKAKQENFGGRNDLVEDQVEDGRKNEDDLRKIG
jgi:hypothetical protein